jgi:hypothetical protein
MQPCYVNYLATTFFSSQTQRPLAIASTPIAGVTIALLLTRRQSPHPLPMFTCLHDTQAKLSYGRLYPPVPPFFHFAILWLFFDYPFGSLDYKPRCAAKTRPTASRSNATRDTNNVETLNTKLRWRGSGSPQRPFAGFSLSIFLNSVHKRNIAGSPSSELDIWPHSATLR